MAPDDIALRGGAIGKSEKEVKKVTRAENSGENSASIVKNCALVTFLTFFSLFPTTREETLWLKSYALQAGLSNSFSAEEPRSED